MLRTVFKIAMAFAMIASFGGTLVGQDEPASKSKDNASSSQTETAAQQEQSQDSGASQSESTKTEDDSDSRNSETISLFDGESMDGWELSGFGTERDCRAENGCMLIEAGYPISGVTSTLEDLPTTNFELSLEAKKVDGIDFFCALTFPVDESHCTFVVGGWAGAVVGLSCIDGDDASRNDTRKLMKFEKDRWYKIRVRVAPNLIQAWIDDEQVVNENIEGKEISLRNEVLPSRPLGISNFETTSLFRNIQLKKFGLKANDNQQSEEETESNPSSSTNDGSTNVPTTNAKESKDAKRSKND